MPYIETPDQCPKCSEPICATVLKTIFGRYFGVRFCKECDFEETTDEFHERLLTP